MAERTKTRRYRKRKRAIHEEETRQRITEAAVELHRTAGPANTKVTEIAMRAGVSRMTVYNHFPTDAALFEACSTSWFERNPLPDLDSWTALSDAGERLRLGLREIYQWYRGAQEMMGNVLRDAAIVPALGEIMDARWWPYVDRMVDTLAEEWSGNGAGEDLRAALRLVVDFRTWKVLTGSGLSDAKAAELAFRMVKCSAVHVPER